MKMVEVIFFPIALYLGVFYTAFLVFRWATGCRNTPWDRAHKDPLEDLCDLITGRDWTCDGSRRRGAP